MNRSFMLLAIFCTLSFTLCGQGGTLSSSLSGFLAFKAAGDPTGVYLKWAPSNELNYSHFEVEKSKDSLEFVKIGQVEGVFGSSPAKPYFFEYLKPDMGMSYYRIKVVDFEGNALYSEVKSVFIEASEFFHLYPGRSTETLILELSSFLTGASFELYSISGGIFSQGKFEGRTFSLDLSGLKSGCYLIKVITQKGNLSSKKFIKT